MKPKRKNTASALRNRGYCRRGVFLTLALLLAPALILGTLSQNLYAADAPPSGGRGQGVENLLESVVASGFGYTPQPDEGNGNPSGGKDYGLRVMPVTAPTVLPGAGPTPSSSGVEPAVLPSGGPPRIEPTPPPPAQPPQPAPIAPTPTPPTSAGPSVLPSGGPPRIEPAPPTLPTQLPPIPRSIISLPQLPISTVPIPPTTVATPSPQQPAPIAPTPTPPISTGPSVLPSGGPPRIGPAPTPPAQPLLPQAYLQPQLNNPFNNPHPPVGWSQKGFDFTKLSGQFEFVKVPSIVPSLTTLTAPLKPEFIKLPAEQFVKIPSISLSLTTLTAPIKPEFVKLPAEQFVKVPNVVPPLTSLTGPLKPEFLKPVPEQFVKVPNLALLTTSLSTVSKPEFITLPTGKFVELPSFTSALKSSLTTPIKPEFIKLPFEQFVKVPSITLPLISLNTVSKPEFLTTAQFVEISDTTSVAINILTAPIKPEFVKPPAEQFLKVPELILPQTSLSAVNKPEFLALSKLPILSVAHFGEFAQSVELDLKPLPIAQIQQNIKLKTPIDLKAEKEPPLALNVYSLLKAEQKPFAKQKPFVDYLRFLSENKTQRDKTIARLESLGISESCLKGLRLLDEWRTIHDKFIALSQNAETLIAEDAPIAIANLNQILAHTKKVLDQKTKQASELLGYNIIEEYITQEAKQAIPAATPLYPEPAKPGIEILPVNEPLPLKPTLKPSQGFGIPGLVKDLRDTFTASAHAERIGRDSTLPEETPDLSSIHLRKQ